MDELIETVAVAIHDEDYSAEPWRKFSTLDDDDADQYRRVARAALDALKAVGWEVVKLPEPSHIGVVAINMEPRNDDGELTDPELLIIFKGLSKPGRLFDRRELAGELLAADRAAEAAQ